MPSSSRKLLSTTSEQWRLAREDLHVRNTTDTKRDIGIEIYDDNKVCCHTAHYQLLSGQSGCSVNLLQAGCYKVKAVLDQQHESVATVTVSDEPEQTIFIHIQNEGITIKEGVTPSRT
ncbi:hypothetical protein Har1130_16865 [Haloarcula sp. CBA1130]|uniref:hypothetical protein n=1 Tax=unclassified Haloarcula TaxID=2624677 RepID=UPI0012483AFE|nr:MULTISPECIES: hypothetical protein [unclassified Haloarcula]KAA9395783.1 hypothetical protein Har1129_20275 [Haloarcula sp. CBA1129]KAA9395792.1 hypothetical protein Har1129_20225 [Haloarcula sp. CBA1129]KAA9396056.1 hypothetical protein Har1129_19375 [Haloarcula sp. CBA1129]KAA9400414.1 hypothetical protein Har1130_16865 [Haloarcula sp. CBA1130]